MYRKRVRGSAPELKKAAPDLGDSPTENERVYRKKTASDIGDSPSENERVYRKRVCGSAPELEKAAHENHGTSQHMLASRPSEACP